MDEDYVDMGISVEEMTEWLPSYDERRAILARDGLASVDGFRITILLTLEYIMGMRVCSECPDCNHKQRGEGDDYWTSCQDLFGNNAYSDGGVFGRVEGIYISIEAQKSAGSLHAHGQVHVACIHQHTPLIDIMAQLQDNKPTLVSEYLRYKAHVCREVYENVTEWNASKREEVEEAWPEYKHFTDLVSKPHYMSSELDPTEWRKAYLCMHVDRIAQLKQHHVHVRNSKGERVPLTHCQRADDPRKCKGDFPRTAWFIETPVVLCPGLMQRMNLPTGGRRNRLGSLHGPRNEANYNGTSPALTAFLHTNSDVQLPYRFGITAETHSDQHCIAGCVGKVNVDEVNEALQCAQDAQAGYACDYQNKRAARCCNEVKECMKGHKRLAQSLENQRPAYHGKRHVTRLCSDAYGRGMVRSNQESTNLRVSGRDDNVTSAESFHTASFVNFPGRDLTRWREAIYQNESYVDMLGAINVDWRNPQRRTPIMRNLVFLYGHRPQDCPEIWYLSPYEFMVYWSVRTAEYSRDPDVDHDEFPAKLTENGIQKIRKQKGDVAPILIGGEDYVLKTWDREKHNTWLPLPDNDYTQEYRHDWVYVRNHRPTDPSFTGCPMPRRGAEEQERNAALILTYFHAFTLNPSFHSEHVPFLGKLCVAGKSWHASLLEWFDGRVLSEETKRDVSNFLVVTRARPDEDDDIRSEDQFSDSELLVGEHNFEKIVKTRMGGGLSSKKDSDVNDLEKDDVGVLPSTVEAFSLAQHFWPVPSAQTEMQRTGESNIDEERLDTALKAAAASQKKEFQSNSLDEKDHDPSVRSKKNTPLLICMHGWKRGVAKRRRVENYYGRRNK